MKVSAELHGSLNHVVQLRHPTAVAQGADKPGFAFFTPLEDRHRRLALADAATRALTSTIRAGLEDAS